MEDGFVKVYREIREWSLFNDSRCVHMLVYLLSSANHKKKKFFFDGKEVEVDEGQLITGREKISIETGIPCTSIERILGKLEKVGEIEQRKTTRNRLITMKKWNKFQAKRTTDGQQTDNERTTSGQQTDTNKNVKNEKNDKNKSVETPLSIALENFYLMRKQKKNPMTDRAKELLMIDLKKLSSDEQTQIKIIEQSILRGWAGVFPLNVQVTDQSETQSQVKLSPEAEARIAEAFRLDEEAKRKQKEKDMGVNHANAAKLDSFIANIG